MAQFLEYNDEPALADGGIIVLSGYADAFDRADGDVDHGWNDLADELPFHEPAQIVGGKLGAGASPTYGQLGVWRELGRDGSGDGFEIELDWTFEPDLSNVGWQAGALAFFNPAGAEGEQGLAFYYDISLSGNPSQFFGIYGMFDAVDFLTPAHYLLYEFNWLSHNSFHSDRGKVATIGLRVAHGQVEGRVDGERVCGPIPIPAWAEGIDAWGVNNIMAPTPLNLGNIDAIRIRDWTEPLGAHPVASVPAAGATVKASTAATIDVAYPASPSAGDQIVAVLTTINGDIATPSGWTSKLTQQVTSGIRLHVFTKAATGSESGDVTFSRSSGTGHCGGFMFLARDANPAGNATSGSGQANTSSTSIASPDQQIGGLDKLIVWIGAVAANSAITVPAGYTSIANLGTSGAAINCAAGYKLESSVPISTLTGPTGTVAAANASVGASMLLHPDPR
jgi:hypothetical protein